MVFVPPSSWNLEQWGEGQCKRTIILPDICNELNISLLPFFFHNGCLSRLCLGKYKRDWYKPCFLDRWQWKEGQCTWIIILPCILTSLSPLKQFCPIIVACPGHFLESIKGIVIKLVTYMRGSAEDKNHNPILHFPLVISLYYFS